MSANLRIIASNDGDAAVLTTSPAAVATLPVGNLQDQTRARVWRSTSTAAQAILGTWADSRSVSAFALVRHNLSPNATVRFRLWDAPGQTGNVLYDSGVIAIGTMIGWGPLVWGIDPWGGANIFSGWAYAWTELWFSAVAARSFQIDLTDSANPAGYMQASRLFIGQYFEPVKNMDYGLTLSWEESSTQRRTDGGTLRTDNFDPFRRWTFQLSNLSEAERSQLMDIIRKIGMRQDFFMSCFPDVGGTTQRDYAGQCKIVQMPSFTKPSISLFQAPFVIEES